MLKYPIAIFAGGCFWCTEAVYQKLRGVKSVTPGYIGGNVSSPSYEKVSSGLTGHAEAIRVEFDDEEISYRDLLEVFFATHDPTTLNRQGADIGTQYRSAIFFADGLQQQAAQRIIDELESIKVYSGKIVTTLEPVTEFYEAEDYHKNYFLNNPEAAYCQVVINPKLEKFKQKFAKLLLS